jgi:hypothetical protein
VARGSRISGYATLGPLPEECAPSRSECVSTFGRTPTLVHANDPLACKGVNTPIAAVIRLEATPAFCQQREGADDGSGTDEQGRDHHRRQ